MVESRNGRDGNLTHPRKLPRPGVGRGSLERKEAHESKQHFQGCCFETSARTRFPASTQVCISLKSTLFGSSQAPKVPIFPLKGEWHWHRVTYPAQGPWRHRCHSPLAVHQSCLEEVRHSAELAPTQHGHRCWATAPRHGKALLQQGWVTDTLPRTRESRGAAPLHKADQAMGTPNLVLNPFHPPQPEPYSPLIISQMISAREYL